MDEPAFALKKREDGRWFPFVNLLPFYYIVEKAVDMFLSDLDSIPYESYWIKTIAEKDAKLKVTEGDLLPPSSGIINLPTDILSHLSTVPSGNTSTLQFVQQNKNNK